VAVVPATVDRLDCTSPGDFQDFLEHLRRVTVVGVYELAAAAAAAREVASSAAEEPGAATAVAGHCAGRAALGAGHDYGNHETQTAS